MKRIKDITILYNVVKELPYGEKEDLLTEVDTVVTAQEVYQALQEEGFITQLFELNERTAGKLFGLKTDLIFNLAYGIGERPKTEAEVVKILEQTNIPFTGGSSSAIELTTDKVATKRKFEQNNILTPLYQVFVSPREPLNPNLSFPLMVKPRSEDCSLGIHNNAVVVNEGELRQRLDYLFKTYQDGVLVEEYIEGRELNITIIGNDPQIKMLPVSEIVFGPSYLQEGKWRIVDFAAKWLEDSLNFKETQGVCPAPFSDKLKEMIEEVAIKAYKICDCRDYARIDIRLSQDKIPYFLEINVNPGIGPADGAVRSAKAAGFTYPLFLKEIVKIATLRHSTFL